MAWYSILPPQLIHLESWAARIFILLGLITIGPWAALIIFDAALYLYRMVIYELPVIGGRARGEQRPRAPSLNERPDGQRRAFGLRGMEVEVEKDRQQESGQKSVLPGNNEKRRDMYAHTGSDGDVKRRR